MIGFLVTVLKWLVAIGIAAWLAMLLLDWIGPTEPVSLVPRFDAAAIGDDPDAWLAERESQVLNLRDNAAKEIVWAGAKGARTEWAIVYLHGFSASKGELRPVPDRVAEALGANLFLTRLSGHGRDGAAMAEPTVQDWIDDVAEAVAVGKRLGDKVVLIGTSTGATLATIAAARPELNDALAGVVLISPNYRPAGWAGRFIEWPWFRSWGPLVLGRERSWEPLNPEHGANWTHAYPMVSVAPLGALTRTVRGLDFKAIRVPALFLVSTTDKTIDTRIARRIAAEWGAPSELVPVILGPNDDPNGHVLAGDILSPSRTAPVVERIVAWIRGL
jgi:pimeloyl-ACP methyl ester carboxylesterase